MKTIINLKYILYVILIGLIVYTGPKILLNYQESGHFNSYVYNVVLFIFNGSIGLILGLDKLFYEVSKEGSWKVNLSKILIMGMPSFYFACGIIISMSFRNFLSYPINILFNNGPYFMYIFQVVFAYSAITSLYKQNI